MSPSLFHLHRVAFIDTLNRPEKDMTDWVEGDNIPSYNFRPKKEETVGGGYRTKSLGDGPNIPGIVMDVSTTDLAEWKVEFVERLPFQAFR